MRSIVRTALVAASLAVTAGGAAAQHSPVPHPLFDGDAVHTIRLTFHQPGWWELLVANFEGLDDPLYLAAGFEWQDVRIDAIGVRFKGNSSYNDYPGPKKSFKLKFDEYEDRSVYGLDKLNLNNAYRNPSFVREKIAYELTAETGMPTGRTNYAALYVNGEYWGLYYLVEQVDGDFVESRFGTSEDGNLWKAGHQATLEDLGPLEASYYPHYELKTNETANDWSALVELVAALNQTPTAGLAAAIEPLLDVNSAMAMLAANAAVLNLDSYTGSAHNFYVYHRDGDGRFVCIPWDVNGAFGTHRFGMTTSALANLSVLWTGGGQPVDRPLAERLWEVPAYRALYDTHIRRLAAGGLHPDRLLPRIEALRDLVRPYVRADRYKMYSDAQFEAALTQPIGAGHNEVPALESLVRDRHASLVAQLGGFAGRAQLALGELMASNVSTAQDGAGDFDGWFEVANDGTQPVSLLGVTASVDLAQPTAYAFPDVMLQPGARYVVWADGEPTEGPDHAAFTLRAQGASLFLFDGGELLDETSWEGLEADQAFGRSPLAGQPWTYDLLATPGAPNRTPPATGEVLINEFLAGNATGATDEAGQHEDWIELYNPGAAPVDLTGYTLTDDLSDPTQWTFPAVSIPAGGHLVVWCDDDAADGPLHAAFKLAGSGEQIGLFGPVASGSPRVDALAFGGQDTDVSRGRLVDGSPTWTFRHAPSPGAPNPPVRPRAHLYGIGKRTSIDSVPLLEPVGEATVPAGTVELRITNARPNNFGILFHGLDRYRAPFFEGELWVAPPVTRVGVAVLDATGTASYTLPVGAPLIGVQRNYQYFFRDPPHPDGSGAGVTNAVEVVFGP